jgi:hypothetical protein
MSPIEKMDSVEQSGEQLQEHEYLDSINKASDEDVTSALQSSDLAYDADNALDDFDGKPRMSPQQAKDYLDDVLRSHTAVNNETDTLELSRRWLDKPAIINALVALSAPEKKSQDWLRLSVDTVVWYGKLARAVQFENKVSRRNYTAFTEFMREQKSYHLVTHALNRFTTVHAFTAQERSLVEGPLRTLLQGVVNGKEGQEKVDSQFTTLLNNSEYIPFKNVLQHESNEIRAVHNRAYIEGLFTPFFDQGVMRWSQKVTSQHLQTMLGATDAKAVNMMALWMSELEQHPEAMGSLVEQLAIKIQKKITNWTLASWARFAQVSVDELTPNVPLAELKASQIRVEYKEPSVKETLPFVPILQELKVLRDNPDISEIILTLPSNSSSIMVESMVEIISDINVTNPTGPQIKITFDNNPEAVEARLDAVERKESIFSSPRYALERLEYNHIGNLEAIGKVIDAMPSQPGEVSLKEIVHDPSYTILWWEIVGSASHVRTDHASVFTQDQRILSRLAPGVQLPINNPQDKDVTNNPTLSFDRAASFLDYLLEQEGKIAPEAKFSLTYGVNGPLNNAMDQLYGAWTPQFESARAEGAKAYQHAALQFTVKKTEEKQLSRSFPPTKEPVEGGAFSVGVVSNSPQDKWSSTRIPWTRISIDWPNIFRGKPNPRRYENCYRW